MQDNLILLALTKRRCCDPYCRNLALDKIVTGIPKRINPLRSRSMHDVIIVYWRDIPAQVIVGKGRRAKKIQLSERFEQAIDRAAMKSDQKTTDDYLAEWRKAEPFQIVGDPEHIAEEQAKKIEAEYDKEKLIALVNNNGRAK